MNVDQILQSIQDFRSQLEVWGITSEALWFLGAAAGLLFLLSLLEVSSWYFRVNQVREEIREMRGQVANLQRSMDETRDLLESMQSEESETPSKGGKPESPTANLFRFDH
jgi:hypothetical protein